MSGAAPVYQLCVKLTLSAAGSDRPQKKNSPVGAHNKYPCWPPSHIFAFRANCIKKCYSSNGYDEDMLISSECIIHGMPPLVTKKARLARATHDERFLPYCLVYIDDSAQ